MPVCITPCKKDRLKVHKWKQEPQEHLGDKHERVFVCKNCGEKLYSQQRKQKPVVA